MSDSAVVADALVLGAGHNGLVAANMLADKGWDVAVLEASDVAGGAVRTDREGEFLRDTFSAFYPLAVASPVLRALRLTDHGLRWTRAPNALAHVTLDGRCVYIAPTPEETAASLDALAPGDGERFLALYRQWTEIGARVLDLLLRPFPPLVAAARLLAQTGLDDGRRLARRAMLPVSRLGEEEFSGEESRLLFAGNALHADLSPEDVLSGFFGWLLVCLGQEHGFPVPEGGARGIVDALVSRLHSRGGRLITGAEVTRVLVTDGEAHGVVTADGRTFTARRAVLADIDAPRLYLELVGTDALAPDFLDDLSRFQYDSATVKVDWSLSAPVPWTAGPARRAGTVHVADSMRELSSYHFDMAQGRIPADPFLVVGQMTTSDPGRSPEGTESLWAYTHVPQSRRWGGPFEGDWSRQHALGVAERIEERIEKCAPGFRDAIIDRRVLGPDVMQSINGNLVGGAINGGTAQLYQQLVFRPVPGWGRAETPIGRLYLASASAHPGGGVHGACGANAARAALWSRRRRQSVVVGGTGVAAATATGFLRRR